jgi:hypothetical protein
MSEYQYYEFRAIDRPLSEKQMDDLRDLSTRAEITPTGFTNTYNYGDFRGSPEKLMDRYFDAFVYVANWGTRRLMFRIPRKFFDVEAAKAYCDEDNGLSLKAGKEHVVLEFQTDDEEAYGWEEGEGWMSSLLSLRADLMRGDLRALYLGWLATLEAPYRDEDEDDEQVEPPVPPGLKDLSAPLKALAEFLRIDTDLLEAASAPSTGDPPSGPSRDDLARWIKALPASDKNDYLTRFLAEDGDLFLRAEISKRFREATAPKRPSSTSTTGRRTVAQLREVQNALIAKQEQEAARKKAREDQKKARSRAEYLENLATREPEVWQEVEALINTKQQNDYDQAVSLLVDLRDLADRSGRSEEVDARLRDLRQKHSKKTTLIRRFNLRDLGR